MNCKEGLVSEIKSLATGGVADRERRVGAGGEIQLRELEETKRFWPDESVGHQLEAEYCECRIRV